MSVNEDQVNVNPPQVELDARRLIKFLSRYPAIAVAFSGGVDSSVVLAAAQRADLSRVVAVTAVSPSVAQWQLELSQQIASQVAVEHWVVETHEISLPEYQRNDSQRCFFCKQTLYRMISNEIRRRSGSDADDPATLFHVASGTNHDDLGDHRPGIRAGVEQEVLTPLATLGLGKSRVRALADHWRLPNHDLPASPCLASRIAYGVSVTRERLAKIEEAEGWLAQQGFREFRVRLHEGELARIEVAREEMERIVQLEVSGKLSNHLREIGFRFITLDLQGFRSGSMNRELVEIGVKPKASGT